MEESRLVLAMNVFREESTRWVIRTEVVRRVCGGNNAPNRRMEAGRPDNLKFLPGVYSDGMASIDHGLIPNY